MGEGALRGEAVDRFESEDIAFHERLRDGFRAIAASGPGSIASTYDGATLTVFSQAGTGIWPTSYDSDGTPDYTGGTTSTGVRPTDRAGIRVDWVQVVPGEDFPPGVASGTAGMLNGKDFKVKVS